MSHSCVMVWHIMFSKITQFVGFDWDQLYEEVYLACSILDPIESHVHCFGFFCLPVDLTMHNVVELSVYIGVGGC